MALDFARVRTGLNRELVASRPFECMQLGPNRLCFDTGNYLGEILSNVVYWRQAHPC